MFRCTIPYRRYKKKYSQPYLAVSQEYKRLIKHIQKAIASNKEIQYEHTILSDGKSWYVNKWYDQIEVTIE